MRPWSLLAVASLVLCWTAAGRAQPTVRTAAPAWSEVYPNVRADLAAGRPLVIHVTVPLCDNAALDCGASWAGQPGRLETNLYWGAIFGARRIFERPRSAWTRVELSKGDAVLLERAVYRRSVPARFWGLDAAAPIEQLVVLQAVHGAHIDRALRELWTRATAGSELEIGEGEAKRRVRVHVAGYAGHNRLMDGVALPRLDANAERAPVASFVLACYSDRYFTEPLERAGSTNLVSTSAFMAPEGYLIDAVARGLGDNLDERALTEQVIRTYAAWQRISVGQARWVFRARRRR